MCGILGLLGDVPTRERMAAAAATLAHRGPDDVGVHVEPGLGLAARRLAILDLEAGHQPLANESGDVWVAHNGEIFNTPELRRELEARGHRFVSRSDTEVLAHGWEEWGPALPERLRGMFAFAVWDRRDRTLFLARDRFGMKPLYLARRGPRLAFASEIGTLFALLPDLERRPDYEALGWCMCVGFAPEPLAVVAGVRKLPAATCLTVADGHETERRYWRLERPRRGDHDLRTGREARDAFLHELTDAVRAWTLSDVPVGTLLSGGIDSSAVAALLVRTATGPVRSVTVGFGDLGHDESALARATAAHLGTEHHEVRLGDREVDDLPMVVRHLGEPRRSVVHLALWVLFREVRRLGLKVVMSGEGSDELLGGYSWYHGEHLFDAITRLPAPLRAALAALPVRVPPAARAIVARGVRDPVQRFALWMTTHWGAPPAGLYLHPLPDPVAAWPRQLGADAAALHPLDQVALAEQHTRLPGFIIHGLDRMSMAHSVEARTPFLDHRLWELAARIEPLRRLNLAGDKRPLRRAMRSTLPGAVRRRGKHGLGVLLAPWWRRTPLPEWAADCLSPREIDRAGYFRSAAVAELLAAHRNGATNEAALATVLTTQLWHRQVIEATS